MSLLSHGIRGHMQAPLSQPGAHFSFGTALLAFLLVFALMVLCSAYGIGVSKVYRPTLPGAYPSAPADDGGGARVLR